MVICALSEKITGVIDDKNISDEGIVEKAPKSMQVGNEINVRVLFVNQATKQIHFTAKPMFLNKLTPIIADKQQIKIGEMYYGYIVG